MCGELFAAGFPGGKNLPAMQEVHVRSLGQEVPLERRMATHPSILAWRILWTEEPVGYSPWGCKESGMTEQVTLSLSLAEVPKRIVGKVRRGTVMCGSEKEAQSLKRLGLQIG